MKTIIIVTHKLDTLKNAIKFKSKKEIGIEKFENFQIL